MMLREHRLVSRLITVFEPRVFPGVLVAFLRMMQSVQDSLRGSEFTVFKSEAVSLVERLALLAVTGVRRVLLFAIWIYM
ncbi:hypothetical protein V1517DRAFT_334777 [Lipomyces orientalis]|uniref:Uncharacterized protein n=1 Tax=Lipomyces orientalis TaxID=1233043 RepID=A0ACC3TC98_9ASCO